MSNPCGHKAVTCPRCGRPAHVHREVFIDHAFTIIVCECAGPDGWALSCGFGFVTAHGDPMEDVS